MGMLGPMAGPARWDNFHSQGLRNGIRYPSPFFDIAHTYLPTSVKQMLRWCRYYFLTNPVVNAITYKLAEYPITPLIFNEPDEKLRNKWQDISENQLKIRAFQTEVGLDYFAYGNAFITIHFPFQKYLTCGNCDKDEKIETSDYKFRNLHYELACKHCGVITKAKVRDENIKSLKGIRLLRWNPEYITLEHNELTGDTAYFFEIPMTIRNDIVMGKRHIVETIPEVFLKALRENKSLRLLNENVFHLKRPTIAEKDMGWGMPLLLPVMKDAFYLQILRKAQEAIAQGYILPLRIIFPQAGGATSDPYTTTDLGTWRRRMEKELEKWRLDPNYTPIMPLPIGNEVIGGEAKNLMLHQEMRAWTEQIIAGMGVPVEFFFGGLSFSGSNMSMRMLENQFLKYRTEQLILVRDFILGKIADFLGWQRPSVDFKRFKMADDLQRAALMVQLNQMQKISDRTMLDELDYDLTTEEKHRKVELAEQMAAQRQMQIEQAVVQGEVQVIQAKYQAQIQKLMGALGALPPSGAAPELPDVSQMNLGQPGTQQPLQGEEAAPGMPANATVYPENAQEVGDEGVPPEMLSPMNLNAQQNGLSLLELAKRAVAALEKMDESTRTIELMKMRVNPQLYGLVLQMLTAQQGAQTNPLDALQMPMPEIKPPRREGSL